MKPASVAAGLKRMILRYNKRVALASTDAITTNERVLQEVEAGNLTAAEAGSQLLATTRAVSIAIGSMQVGRFLQRFKWKARKMSAPGNSLEYSHPSNVLWRSNFEEQCKALGIRQELLLNYDQVWRLKWRGSPSTLSKTGLPRTQRDTRSLVFCLFGYWGFGL